MAAYQTVRSGLKCTKYQRYKMKMKPKMPAHKGGKGSCGHEAGKKGGYAKKKGGK